MSATLASTGFTPVILAHTLAALAAVLLGAVMFIARKGTLLHRISGRFWLTLMLLTALSSFWIRSSGGFSWIHGLSVLTLAAIAGGLYFAIRGNILRHRRIMASLYFGGLLIAGFFTLLPQRLLGRAVWGALGLA